MLKTPELSNTSASATMIDLIHRTHEKKYSLPDNVTLKGEEVGAELYPTMLALTAQDMTERGITVSRGIFGKIKTSGIANGTRNHNGTENHVDYPPPPLLNRVLSYVHTHPPLMEINPNIPTSIPDDGDYLTFFGSDAASYVTLDEGGVHVFLKKKRFHSGDPLPNNLVEKSVEMSLQGRGLTIDAMKNLASFLDSYGIGYYFSPSHTLTSEGFLELKEVRNYKILPAKQIGDKS